MPWTWTIAFTAATLGFYLLRRGLKGKLLDDHPLCRHCQFDLFNKPADSTRCPECGSDLNLPNSTLPGHRQRRPFLITLGSFLLIPLITLAIFINAGIQFDWIKYEPVWMLTSQAQSPDPATNSPALSELLQRAQTGLISPLQLSALANIAIQNVHPANPCWDQLLELAHSTGALSPSQQQAYTALMLQRVNDFEKSIAVNSVRLMVDQWHLDLTHASSPLPLAFDVTVRNEKNQWSGGSLLCSPQIPRSHVFIFPRGARSRQPIELDETSVDIVLHPNPSLSSLPPGLASVLGQDITLKNIHVDDPFGEARRQQLQFQRQIKEDHGKQIAAVKDAKGVILRVQTHNVAAGLGSSIADGLLSLATGVPSQVSVTAPLIPEKDCLDLLIFPGLPFQSRVKVDNGFVTVQGELRPGSTDHSFTLHCRLSEDQSDAHSSSHSSLENTLPIELGTSFTLGISNSTSWRLTLAEPDDATDK